MMIDSLLSGAPVARDQNTQPLGNSANFQALLAQASKAINTREETLSAAAQTAISQAKQQAAEQAEYANLKNALEEYLSKSPAEHMRDAILKEMGITEEELNAKPPEERMVLEEEINRRIKERLVGKQEGDAEASTLRAIEAAFRHLKTDGSQTSSDKSSPVNAAVIAQLMAQTSASSSL